VFQELAAAIRGIAQAEARNTSPPIARYKVKKADPLVLEEIGGDGVLEEGDDDVEIDRGVLDERPDVGDTVRVHQDTDGDWIVSGVVSA